MIDIAVPGSVNLRLPDVGLLPGEARPAVERLQRVVDLYRAEASTVIDAERAVQDAVVLDRRDAARALLDDERPPKPGEPGAVAALNAGRERVAVAQAAAVEGVADVMRAISDAAPAWHATLLDKRTAAAASATAALDVLTSALHDLDELDAAVNWIETIVARDGVELLPSLRGGAFSSSVPLKPASGALDTSNALRSIASRLSPRDTYELTRVVEPVDVEP